MSLSLAFAGVTSFQAGPLVAPVQRSNAVAMSGTLRPSDFPVKNVWTTVCSSKDLKVLISAKDCDNAHCDFSTAPLICPTPFASLSDIARLCLPQPSSLKAAFGAGQDILIATDKGGKTFAAANVCPHIGTPLDQGTVENGAIICPLHRSAFDLRTGKLVGPWCPAPPLIGPLTGTLKSPKELQTFQCRQQGGKVQVLLDVNAKKRFETTFWRGILDAQGKVDGGYY
jgi:nitrite reductase/ring-hydroxylating ferredoxin subunit